MIPSRRARLLVVPLLLTMASACGKDGGPESADTTTMTTTTGSETTTTEDAESTSSSTSSDTAMTQTSSESSSSTGEPDPDSSSSESTGTAGPPRVAFETTLGTIVLQLDEVAAPITAANFLTYVDGGFFDGTDGNGATIFHRVVPGFVVQGGGLTEDLQTKNTLPPIQNESGNGLANVRGAISMARTKDPNSATCQFFINLVDNDFLDEPPGYAVFGAVVEGMDVVDAMAAVQTTTMGQFDDVPVEPIVVIAVERL
jgi:cyclophilin family peptidyl-prolyl cis-trans isomerase